MNTYLIDTYRAGESFAHCHGHLWVVCNTPLHGYTKNGSLWVCCFNGESNFWSVCVVAYCIRPKTYRADDSIDKRESNFWSVRVGEYCIHPKTYRSGDSMDKRELIFWSVCVGAYCIRLRMYWVDDSMVFRHTHFWREKDSINTYSIDTYWTDESFSHCHGDLWGVCHTSLHRYTENGSLWVGGFNGESNFWRV